MIEWGKSGLGMAKGTFPSIGGQRCTVEETASGKIFVGHPGYMMFLDRDMVRGLAEVLQLFADTGSLDSCDEEPSDLK